MTIALGLLGLCAGVLTMLAGQGGGLFLLICLSVLVGPRAALAITAPALLLGNLHRAALLRRWIDRAAAGRLIAGAAPGALLGGLLAGALPEHALHALLVALTALALARALGWLVIDVPRWAFVPAGAVVGTMTGAAGGAGVLLAPVLLAAGLRGPAFVGTSAAVALTMHAGRVVAYASEGMFTRDLAAPIAAVSIAITAGNALGERARARLTDKTTTLLEYGVLLICVCVSLAGLH